MGYVLTLLFNTFHQLFGILIFFSFSASRSRVNGFLFHFIDRRHQQRWRWRRRRQWKTMANKCLTKISTCYLLNIKVHWQKTYENSFKKKISGCHRDSVDISNHGQCTKKPLKNIMKYTIRLSDEKWLNECSLLWNWSTFLGSGAVFVC